MSDGLEGFDGFTRRAAAGGMFNRDQVEHMRYLSRLPREARCRCGWDVNRECAGCNLDDFRRAGIVRVDRDRDFNGGAGSSWDGRSWRPHGHHSPLDYRLPDGRMTGYRGAVEWLSRKEGP